jgi:hypothetical protein
VKLKSLLFVSMFTVASSAFAQFFPATTSVTIHPSQVSVEVYNPYYEPIVCNGQVFGQIFAGQVFNAYFAEQLLPAGAHRYAYVVTNFRAPFVGGWANIHCRFARWW